MQVCGSGGIQAVSTCSSILVDNQLHILAELLVALLVVRFILSKFFKNIRAFFDKIFPCDLENLALLQHLTRDVQ